MPVIVERTSLEDVRAANPTRIWYSVNTCWWTHRAEDLHQHRDSGLPCDPRGGMLLMTDEGDAEKFLKSAEDAAAAGHYGRHGMRAFMAAHRDNCIVSVEDGRHTCLEAWPQYNDLLDEADGATE